MASEPRLHSASCCRAGKLRDAGRRRRRWCHDHARSKRRSAGMESSLPMLVPSSAIFTAARSRVWAHPTTCCAMSFDVRQQHVQRSETGRVSTVSECGGPVRIIYQPSVTRHALVQARKGARSIGPISTRIDRGAASELPMVPEARHGGHSRSVMVSVRPVLSTTIIV